MKLDQWRLAACLLGAAVCGAAGAGCGSDEPAPVDPTFAVPAPLRPWNGEATGSVHAARALRPRFQWSAVPGATGYDLQVDDSCPATGFAGCPFPSPEVDARGVSGTTFTTASSLPVSTAQPVGRRYFWRLRACHAAGCSPWSPVRYVDVGRMAQDLNGDGYADVAIGADPGAAGSGKTYVYLGKPGMLLSTTPDLTLTEGEVADGFGYALDAAGDLNADGYGDLIVGADMSAAGGARSGRVLVYLGGSSLATTPDLTLTGAAGDLYGIGVASAGDMDGDGFADFAVGAPGVGAGHVDVYRGGAVLDATPDLRLDGEVNGDFFGYPLRPAGDVNGDGFADLAVSATAAKASAGRVYLYRGGAVAGAQPASTLDAEAAGDALGGLGGPGDVNGDGFADLAVSAYLNDDSGQDAGRLYVYFGGAKVDTTLGATADFTANGAAPNAQLGPLALIDMNGDGLSDIAAAGNVIDGHRTFVYLGGAAPHATADLAIAGTDVPFTVACGGDIDGDGFDDLVVSAPSTTTGYAYVYRGGAQLDGDAAATLPAPTPGDGFGITAM